MIVLMMGVSGAGKSTIGRALAHAVGARFIEGDDFHSQANRSKMCSGQSLDDDDRADWLAALAAQLTTAHSKGESVVLACSALKHAYRQLLNAACPDLRTVWLHGAPEMIARRLAERHHHFMPATLLDSQLATLEAPAEAIMVDITTSPEAIAADLAELLYSVQRGPKGKPGA